MLYFYEIRFIKSRRDYRSVKNASVLLVAFL